jgi:hypothetical protein
LRIEEPELPASLVGHVLAPLRNSNRLILGAESRSGFVR